MLISDAYSWGYKVYNDDIVLIPYYGYICSDDDAPNDYVFNPHPYGVVNVYIDAYIAGIEYFSQNIITCEYVDGNVYNHSDFNSLGVVYGEQDAYFGSTYADDMLICLSWWGYFNNWSYKNADKNGVAVVIERCLFYL